MTDTTTMPRGRAPGNGTTYNPIAGASFAPGTPVRQSFQEDDTVLPAQADSNETAFLMGVAVSSAQRSNHVLVQYSGPLTLTIAEWNVVTGSSTGLVRGAPYFLCASEAGKLTTSAPNDAGTFVVPVGIAMSATDLQVLLGFPGSNGSVE